MLKIKGKPFSPERLPIKDVEWEPLIPYIARSNRALAQYDGVLYGIPNPEVLLSPLTTQEAVLSSMIEGTEATLGDVLRFEAGVEPEHEATRQDIGEILNYRAALQAAKAELETKPFNLNLLLTLHNILLDSVRGRDKGRGRFRTIQNWIGAPGCTIEEAEFVPPEPLQVPGLMSEWEKYYHADRPDALVQLAVVHAQFEMIHPFLDGNGRLGRVLIPLFLYEKKILSQPMFYLSAYLESHRSEYVASLRQLGAEDHSWNQWIIFFLNALTEQAIANTAKARAIMDLYEKLKKRVIELTHSQYAVPLLDVLFKQPVIRATELKDRMDMPTNPMVMHLLSKLEDDGIISVLQKGSGRRPYVFAFGELINLCEGKKVIR